MKKVVVVLANGFEEIEALTPIDILRRAGLDVTVAGVDSTMITGSHGVTVKCDVEISNLESSNVESSNAGNEFSCIVLPGGMPGAKNLINSKAVQNLILSINKDGLVCAICASPAVVLAPLGLLDGKKAVCYPGMESCAPTVNFLKNISAVQDGNIITGAGPGCASEFSFLIAKALVGAQAVEKLKHDMIYIS